MQKLTTVHPFWMQSLKPRLCVIILVFAWQYALSQTETNRPQPLPAPAPVEDLSQPPPKTPGGALFPTAPPIRFDPSPNAELLSAIGDDIGTYIVPITQLCYVVAGLMAIAGVVTVYIKMQRQDENIKKPLIITVLACVFMILAAQALPRFFFQTGPPVNRRPGPELPPSYLDSPPEPVLLNEQDFFGTEES